MSNFISNRVIRIGYYDEEKNFIGSIKSSFELQLKQMGSIELKHLESLKSIDVLSCDLLVIPADHITKEDFAVWLQRLHDKMNRENKIWVPALILTFLPYSHLTSLIDWSMSINWYFDIIEPNHMSSLPIRIVNLLRIHDHLRELNRYNDELQALHKRIFEIENLLEPKLE